MPPDRDDMPSPRRRRRNHLDPRAIGERSREDRLRAVDALGTERRDLTR